MNKDETIQYSAKRFPTLLTEFLKIFFLNKLFPNSKYSEILKIRDGETIEVDWISGALIMYRKEVIIKEGGFDEKYFYGAEDADICYRLKKQGYKVLYTTKCSAVHLGGGTTRKLMHEIFNAPYHGKLLFFEKLYSKKIVVIIKFISIMQTITELVIFIMFYLFSSRKRERASFAIVERYNRLRHFF